MALNFPLNPANNDPYIYNGITYIYDSTVPAWTAAPKDYIAPKVATTGCRVYLSASQVIPTNTTTLIEFNTVDYNYGNNFSSSNHEFTVSAGKEGRYRVESTIRIQNTTSGHYISLYLYVNDTQLKAIVNDHESDTGTDYLSLNISNIVDVSAGDTISIKVKNSDGGSTIYGGTHSTYLSIEYLDEAPIAKIPSVNPIAYKTISSAAMTTAVQTFEEVVMSIIDYDYGSNYNESDGSYTIPVDGVYSFGSHIGIAGGATAQLQMIQSLFTSQNGGAYTEYLRGQNPVMTAAYLAGYSTWSANYEGYFTKGTKVKLYVYTQSATDIYVSANSTRPALWGHLISGSTGISIIPTIGVSYQLLAEQTGITIDTWIKVLFDKNNWDIGLNFASNKFTVPEGGAGKYRINGNLKFKLAVAGDRIGAYVYVNGVSKYYFTNTAASAYDGVSYNQILELAAGDYVEIYAKNNLRTDTLVSSSTFQAEYLDQKVILPFDVETFQPTTGFSAYQSADDTNPTSGQYYTVQCDLTLFNYGNDYDTSTGIYTCPKAGRYHVNAQVWFSGNVAGDELYAMIYKNNSLLQSLGSEFAYDTTNRGANTNKTIYCEAGDELVLKGRNDSRAFTIRGTTIHVTYFTVEYLDERAYNPSIVPATTIPDFQYPALENSWVDFSASIFSRFWKDDNGIVHLEGAIKSGTATAGTTLFTLPEGYRPLYTHHIPIVSNGVFGYIKIIVSGLVTIELGSNVWFSLDGISFSTD